EAYLARRALDYLVGFNLSPVLWRKLPGAKSAGRVQSVALRLIVEREMEVEAFRPREYWSVKALLTTPRGDAFEARVTSLNGTKLDRYDLANEVAAGQAVAAVESAGLLVKSVEAKPTSRNPAAPFMTSTLQQEASRKFGMGAQDCMRTAQRLYEAGHITYMRTDGIDMAPEAVMAARDVIKDRYGEGYLPKAPRMYKNKAKNAQEAHECIRPSRMNVTPDELTVELAQKRLYELIWKRAVSSQMEAARFERTTVEIGDASDTVGLRATGQVVTFDGFLTVYEEGRDEKPQNLVDDDDKRLPQIRATEALVRNSVTPEQHFTQPPPRYTEATLVKRMEELGIGRPSTYASIINTIETREYVRKEKNRLFPEDKGRLVTAFLSNYFSRYVQYDFTAGMEEQLDDISGGRINWQDVLTRFWKDFNGALDETSDLRIGEVLEKINEVLAPHLFPDPGDGSDPRLCPTCKQGRLSMRTARSGGAFIGCSQYPECRYTRPLGGDESEGELSGDGKLLGSDPEGIPVTLRAGRFGPYVQLGEASGDAKPKRSSLPKGIATEDVDLPLALGLLSLPREVGPHPEDGEIIEAGIGRYGPFVKHGKTFASLEKGDDVLTIGMNRAVDLIAQKLRRGPSRGAAQTPLRELGEHPDGGPVNLMDGRYGPYVKWDKINATLPKDLDPNAVTLEQALEFVAAKAATKKPKKAAKKSPARKKAAKNPAAKTGTDG
ncbi:MAG: type I DNA topoisomerase, partial [Pseudomonadota bacterium]